MKIGVVQFSVILPLVFFAVSCGSKKETLDVSVQDITESVYASGHVKSANQYEVFAQASGLVEKIFVSEGDVVSKGQPVMQLSNEPSRLSAENARIAAEETTLAAQRDKLNELRASADIARNRLVNDSILLQRQRNLWAQQIGTRNELDQRELSYQNSRKTYEAAVSRYNDMLRQLGFASRQAQKSLQISREMLRDFTVRSQAAGRVYTILKEVGEMVGPQSPVAVIGDAGSFILELQIDEYDVAAVQPGQKVLVNMDSHKGRVFEARVRRVIPYMNERTRSFSAEADFITMPDRLYPGLTAEANIILQDRKRVITIPRNYLADDSTVILENGDKRKVVTGIRDYQRVEIVSGLRPNETIIKPE
ncbi:MAG TPA: efflux RND transporter periplasmic adaptor subunit [Flavisolibacter sp.]